MFSFEHIIVLLRDYWDVFLLEGLRYTLILSAIAVLFGAVFGSLIAFGRLSNSRILRFICSAYTEVVRDTPLLVQIYLFVLIVPKAIGTIVSLSTFQAVAMAFAFNSAAYVSEIVRSGIQAVDAGQTEAARSLGMSPWMTMMKVVFPQALKNSIPAIGNEMIINIKDSSVLNCIGVVELMYAATSVAGIYYKNLPNYVSAAIIYLIMTCCISALLNKLSARLSLNTYRGIPSSN